MILHDTGRDQGGFGAAEGASQQLTVLREAAGFGIHLFIHSFLLLLWDGTGGVGSGKWSNARFCPEELR